MAPAAGVKKKTFVLVYLGLLHLLGARVLPATTSASRTSLVPVLASAPSTHTSPSAHGLRLQPLPHTLPCHAASCPSLPHHVPHARRALRILRPAHPPLPCQHPRMHYWHQPQLSLPAALCHRTLSSAGPQHRSGHLPTPPSHLPLASRPQALPSYPMLEPCCASASQWSDSRRAAALCR